MLLICNKDYQTAETPLLNFLREIRPLLLFYDEGAELLMVIQVMGVNTT